MEYYLIKYLNKVPSKNIIKIIMNNMDIEKINTTELIVCHNYAFDKSVTFEHIKRWNNLEFNSEIELILKTFTLKNSKYLKTK